MEEIKGFIFIDTLKTKRHAYLVFIFSILIISIEQIAFFLDQEEGSRKTKQ